MQRNQRPPAVGASPYDWHQQPLGGARGAPMQNYPPTNPHLPPSRVGMVHPPSARNPHHKLPPASHSAPLLPAPQSYLPPAPIQGPPVHSGGQKYSPAPHSSREPPQQVSLGDLSASSMSLGDLIPKVQALGFPASCNFVLGLLERYFTSQLDSTKDSSSVPPQLAPDKISTLIDTFIINIDRPQTTPPAAGRGVALPVLNPVKEMQLLLILHAELQEQSNLHLRYCVFDSLFGGEIRISDERFALLCKLVSLSITLSSEGVLLCAATWMKTHPLMAISLTKSLYHDFCVLLPDAMEPLMGVADHSPLLAYHMAAAFTSLYPLHIVGKQLPEVDPAHLHPPLKIVRLVLQWVESKPELLCRSQHPDLEPATLPLLSRSQSSPSHSHSTDSLCSPITGIIQWCILAPMVNDEELYSGTKSTDSKSTEAGTNSGAKQFHFGTKLVDFNSSGSIGTGSSDRNSASSSGAGRTNSRTNSASSESDSGSKEEDGFRPLLACLHAELLSALLSQGQGSAGPSGSVLIDGLVSDDVAVLVASLIAYSQKLGVTGVGTSQKLGVSGVGTSQKVSVAGGGATMMEESVERFAQFLQISMSAQVLQLKPEDIKFIASALPPNRLLELVITHTSKS